MPRYRHKATETEAQQFHDGNPALDPPGVFRFPKTGKPYVITIHGMKTPIEDGDFIVREPDGRHYYPCKPNIFESHYELVET